MDILFANSLNEAVAALFGDTVRIAGKAAVYGGDINEAYRLSLSDGTPVFMKCNTLKNVSFFEAEAKGLKMLRKAGTIGVPKVMAVGSDRGQGMSFLLMEYLEAAPRIGAYWEVFGRELAMLHKTSTPEFAMGMPFGFEADNYIGASPQINTPKADWITFFRECRLLPQFKMAERYFDPMMKKKCTKLLERLDSYLAEPEFPSLIHGDLWSGNAICGPDGKAWILDPAAYVGHFEAELAMTELFGSNPDSFYKAYHEVNPIDGEYHDRRDLYNLYHLLNHLNLFGRSYLGAVQRILSRYT